MPSQEEIQDQQALLATYRRRLAYNLLQQVKLGSATPFPIVEEIRDARSRIRDIKAILRGWKVPTEDHPDDEEPSESQPLSPATVHTIVSPTPNLGPQCCLRIFLCHSSSDKSAVRNLYQRLRADGFDPWLDEENLLPGQEWQQKIPKVVREAHVVLVCLSDNSVTKTGYVQKEIKYALDVADAQPEDTTFLIPVRLEACNVPERLRRWHWVDLFEDRGYERLLRALHARANALDLTIAPITDTVPPSIISSQNEETKAPSQLPQSDDSASENERPELPQSVTSNGSSPGTPPHQAQSNMPGDDAEASFTSSATQTELKASSSLHSLSLSGGKLWILWVVATSIGWLVSLTLGGIIADYLVHTIGISGFLGSVLLVINVGIGLGIAQWFVIQNRIEQGGARILASAMGGVVGGYVTSVDSADTLFNWFIYVSVFGVMLGLVQLGNKQTTFVRSSTDTKIAGVCGGIAQFFGIDSVIVRLLFILAILSGISPLIYLVLWTVMPEEKFVNHTKQPQKVWWIFWWILTVALGGVIGGLVGTVIERTAITNIITSGLVMGTVTGILFVWLSRRSLDKSGI